MEAKNYEFDNLDLKILSLLIENGNMPYTEVAQQVHTSGGTVHVRMRKLEEIGIVKKMQLVVDYQKLGYDVTAYLGIYLNKSSQYRDVVQGLNEIPEIVECHYTTGNYSMFVKVICRDTRHLREVLSEKIQTIEGIQRTETLISLENSIDRPLKFWDDSATSAL
ncbi:MAG: Lrp/AsnC ligand binding domain-containing protein [Sphingobacteriales bacterium]|nr:Lrp/AsnC ligand binding domain-containing protein [Sphingobacteriales bacterium]